MRLRDLLFKAKTPGFGISAQYYQSVICSASVLPSLSDLIRPKLHDAPSGVVQGFGAPLSHGTNSAEALTMPLQRGAYALATVDRKTVLKMLVMGIDDAGFDPRVYANQPDLDEDPELVARLKGAWTITQLSFESHSPSVFPSLLFLWKVCQRLGQLGDGVIADPLSERYLLPEKAFHPLDSKPGEFPFDIRDLIECKMEPSQMGWKIHTCGMRKLALPELELDGIELADQRLAVLFLFGVCQTVLSGSLLSPGHQVGSDRLPFVVAVGGLDRTKWSGVCCFELLPPPRKTSSEALRAWAEDESK